MQAADHFFHARFVRVSLAGVADSTIPTNQPVTKRCRGHHSLAAGDRSGRVRQLASSVQEK